LWKARRAYAAFVARTSCLPQPSRPQGARSKAASRPASSGQAGAAAADAPAEPRPRVRMDVHSRARIRGANLLITEARRVGQLGGDVDKAHTLYCKALRLLLDAILALEVLGHSAVPAFRARTAAYMDEAEQARRTPRPAAAQPPH
jgi:hypothetical protein